MTMIKNIKYNDVNLIQSIIWRRKNMESNKDKIRLKKTNKTVYMKVYRRNQSNNVLEKLKENDESKSIEVDVVSISIKDEVKISFDAEVY